MLASAKFQTRECTGHAYGTAHTRLKRKPGIARLHRYNLQGSDTLETKSDPFFYPAISSKKVETNLTPFLPTPFLPACGLPPGYLAVA